MSIDRLDLIRLKDIAMTKMASYPPRSRIPTMITDITQDELIAMAWFEASLIMLGNLNELNPERISKIIPNLIQVTQDSTFDD